MYNMSSDTDFLRVSVSMNVAISIDCVDMTSQWSKEPIV